MQQPYIERVSVYLACSFFLFCFLFVCCFIYLFIYLLIIHSLVLPTGRKLQRQHVDKHTSFFHCYSISMTAEECLLVLCML